MITTSRAGSIIFTMLATVEDAKTDTNAPLDAVVSHVAALKTVFETNPSAITEASLSNAANMLAGFLSEKRYSITDITRFYKDLDPTNTKPLDATLADGSVLADGSATAA